MILTQYIKNEEGVEEEEMEVEWYSRDRCGYTCT